MGSSVWVRRDDLSSPEFNGVPFVRFVVVLIDQVVSTGSGPAESIYGKNLFTRSTLKLLQFACPPIGTNEAGTAYAL